MPPRAEVSPPFGPGPSSAFSGLRLRVSRPSSSRTSANKNQGRTTRSGWSGSRRNDSDRPRKDGAVPGCRIAAERISRAGDKVGQVSNSGRAISKPAHTPAATIALALLGFAWPGARNRLEKNPAAVRFCFLLLSLKGQNPNIQKSGFGTVEVLIPLQLSLLPFWFAGNRHPPPPSAHRTLAVLAKPPVRSSNCVAGRPDEEGNKPPASWPAAAVEVCGIPSYRLAPSVRVSADSRARAILRCPAPKARASCQQPEMEVTGRPVQGHLQQRQTSAAGTYIHVPYS